MLQAYQRDLANVSGPAWTQHSYAGLTHSEIQWLKWPERYSRWMIRGQMIKAVNFVPVAGSEATVAIMFLMVALPAMKLGG